MSFGAFSGHKTMMYSVHTESRIYYFEQLDTTSRSELSLYFSNSVEVLVDSIRRVLSKMI